MQSLAEEILGDELSRGLVQGGRDLEYLLFIDAGRRESDWNMRLGNLISIIERARLCGWSDERIRATVATGLFSELFTKPDPLGR